VAYQHGSSLGIPVRSRLMIVGGPSRSSIKQHASTRALEVKTPGLFVFKGKMKENNDEKLLHQLKEHVLTAEQLAELIEAKLERARLMQQGFRQLQLAKNVL